MRLAIRRFPFISKHGSRLLRRSFLTESYTQGPSEVQESLPLPIPQLLTTYSRHSSSKPSESISSPSSHCMVIAPRIAPWPFPVDTGLIASSRVVSRHQRSRLTYDGLDMRSNALARGLLSAGVKRGNRVAVSLGNNIEYAVV